MKLGMGSVWQYTNLVEYGRALSPAKNLLILRMEQSKMAENGQRLKKQKTNLRMIKQVWNKTEFNGCVWTLKGFDLCNR